MASIERNLMVLIARSVRSAGAAGAGFMAKYYAPKADPLNREVARILRPSYGHVLVVVAGVCVPRHGRRRRPGRAHAEQHRAQGEPGTEAPRLGDARRAVGRARGGARHARTGGSVP